MTNEQKKLDEDVFGKDMFLQERPMKRQKPMHGVAEHLLDQVRQEEPNG